MRKLLLAFAALALSTSAFAGPYDIVVNQRDSTDTIYLVSTFTPPAANADGLMFLSGSTKVPGYLTLGSGLSISGGVLTAGSFSGAWADLTGVPSTFSPSAHTHAASDVTSGTLSASRLPALAISQTTGLQAALDGKLQIPSGTAAQYLDGTGAVRTFPSAPEIQRYRALTNSSGVYTWTFPTAYGSGVTPVVEVSVEDTSASGAAWQHVITAITNTSVTVQITKTTSVSLLGISVLGISTTPQAYVHLTAFAP